MSHRSYGATRNCYGCRFWSEMLAQASGGSPLEAYCLSPDSPKRHTYVDGEDRCDRWKSGHFGAVDDPENQRDDPYEGESA